MKSSIKLTIRMMTTRHFFFKVLVVSSMFTVDTEAAQCVMKSNQMCASNVRSQPKILPGDICNFHQGAGDRGCVTCPTNETPSYDRLSCEPIIINNNAFSDTMCNVVKIVTGKAGKAFASFAIISVGFGFFTGKVSWGLMIGIAAGVAAIFGAPSILSAVGSFSVNDCG